MRFGKVIGVVTLSREHELLRGGSWRLVLPLSEAGLCGGLDGDIEDVVVYDELSAGEGELIAISEGAEASNPFYPEIKPVDAYNAAILDNVEILTEDNSHEGKGRED
ncbi:MAG: carbon dioxide concentrating mechanism protein CcmL [Planctomycetaceae bacterium]|jgi:ethanolamine utilization protein EutN|nr:carbon dioxide concentrating mechanism protein CcmL [Planctomycetaceae bacterium]